MKDKSFDDYAKIADNVMDNHYRLVKFACFFFFFCMFCLNYSVF